MVDRSPAELVGNYDHPITLGSCVLARAETANAVQDALLHFNQARYELQAWSVMPNHVHAVLSPLGGFSPGSAW